MAAVRTTLTAARPARRPAGAAQRRRGGDPGRVRRARRGRRPDVDRLRAVGDVRRRSTADGAEPRAARRDASSGTLGGGNHFIELCLDTDDTRLADAALRARATSARSWPSSTSRVARKLAAQRATCPTATSPSSSPARRRWRPTGATCSGRRSTRRSTARSCSGSTRACCAASSRRSRSSAPISCHHNYVAEEVHFGEEVLVTRKGAIRAGRGRARDHPRLDGDEVVTSCAASGNPESFESASHGAGRRMSRTEAKQRFTRRRPRRADRGRRVPQGRRRARRDPRARTSTSTRSWPNQSDLVEIVAELRR